ncbi:MAG: hypothetical protein JW861_06960 [Bacteroidales bacterium]|nr:hypothetical protein [Bacteroidales bacterium]
MEKTILRLAFFLPGVILFMASGCKTPSSATGDAPKTGFYQRSARTGNDQESPEAVRGEVMMPPEMMQETEKYARQKGGLVCQIEQLKRKLTDPEVTDTQSIRSQIDHLTVQLDELEIRIAEFIRTPEQQEMFDRSYNTYLGNCLN